MKNKQSFTLIDSHAHLSCESVLPHIEAIIKRAMACGVNTMINICTDVETLEQGILLEKKYPGIIFNVGATTPHDVGKEGGLVFPIFEKAAREGQLVAIGETGLDYHYEHASKEIQQTFLSRYFDLAQSCYLPVVIHCREAFDDLFLIADKHFSKNPKLLLHCFTGNMEEALEAVNRGWMISISGIVTFKRSEELREVVREIPLNHLLVETDTPYLAPQTQRGKLNEPSFMVETAQMIADLKEVNIEEVARITTDNARTFFDLVVDSNQ